MSVLKDVLSRESCSTPFPEPEPEHEHGCEKSETGEKSETTLKCPFCEYRASNLAKLKSHILRHDLSICPVCGKKFKRLLSHVAGMRDEKHQELYALIGHYGKGNRDRLRELRGRFLEK
ncbi:zinc finger C2H2-type domain protein [Ferroglobus placidus DSM 10642]|uniref:Zinc finger C2H2-type domain protein n=1 Tax=Ferroglobus placidus (strain DSM 10642 / AEDII12DO) TaxID=589924 RepID=D3S396_FERPA|nr:zinc finger C2H2-type domain protein [Ferroglobus placidus]ADC64729.1 zinc finger C2H2-type domain protein [Ferroglobus placidus DSM 10642]